MTKCVLWMPEKLNTPSKLNTKVQNACAQRGRHACPLSMSPREIDRPVGPRHARPRARTTRTGGASRSGTRPGRRAGRGWMPGALPHWHAQQQKARRQRPRRLVPSCLSRRRPFCTATLFQKPAPPPVACARGGRIGGSDRIGPSFAPRARARWERPNAAQDR